MSESKAKFPTPEPLHVNCETRTDEKPHDLTVDCWCAPHVVANRLSGTVVNHSGGMRPAVVRGAAFERRFNGLLTSDAPVSHFDRRLG